MRILRYFHFSVFFLLLDYLFSLNYDDGFNNECISINLILFVVYIYIYVHIYINTITELRNSFVKKKL